MAATVSGLGSTYTTLNTTTTDSTANALDSNSFLTMFLTQLQNQDPTNPMESYELSSQLAQFSTLEKLTQQVTLLTNLQNYATSVNNAEMVSVVGKNVKASQSTVDVTADSVGALNYKLDSAATVTVTVSDSSGNVVYSTNKGAQAAGIYSVGWNGTDSTGTRVSDGTYTIDVTAVDSSTSEASTLTTYLEGAVSSCNLEGTPTYKLSDGTKISVSSVYDIGS
ncbi:MAG: hypothetical protein LLG06_00415 [Desulfobacteraceae bacterium]|nr:hypothetical protein [Desulfobacteraceae bacterium]